MSQWADERGYLITGTGLEIKWKTREPQRAILDAFCTPEIEEINLLKSSRFGWTSILMQAMGYFIDQDPSPVLMVQPRMKDMEEWSKEHVQPTIDGNKFLKSKVAAQRQGSSGNTIDHKAFPGGPLRLRASNSPDGFRRYAARVAMCDEVDGYPATSGPDGNIIGLVYSRVQDAWNRIVANGSTPTESDISLIQRLFNESSVGYPFLNCPHCHEPHVRQFHEPQRPLILRGEKVQVSWISWQEGKPLTAVYVCPACGCEIGQKHHSKMLDRCYWVGEHWEYIDRRYKFLPGFAGRIGFSTWAGYVVSPNTTPPKLAVRFIRDRKTPEDHKTFVNTVLGQSWTIPGEELRSDDLYNRREEYAAEVPKEVRYLTAGVDVQDNRWEMEVVGWCPHEETYSIDYQIIPGDPSQDEEWWESFRPYLFETYQHESGAEVPISAIGIDHGHMSKRVETFIRRLKMSNVFGFKGIGTEGRPFVEPEDARKRRLRKQKQSKYRPELLGDFEAKHTTIKRLRVQKPGPGYCHFPMDRDRSWFEQLTAEKLVTKYMHRRAFREWIMLQARNEALDCRKIAHAAFILASPDMTREISMIENRPVLKKKTTVIGSRRRGLM